MDEDYFARPRQQSPSVVEPVSADAVADVDVAMLHEAPASPRGLGGLRAVGYVLFAAGALTVAALPVLGLVFMFRFLDALPF